MRYWVLPLALAMVYAGISEAEIEKHREGTAEYSIEADVVGLEEGWVVLRTSDGKLIALPAKELSRADQRWVQTHALQTQHPRTHSRAMQRRKQPSHFLATLQTHATGCVESQADRPRGQ